MNLIINVEQKEGIHKTIYRKFKHKHIQRPLYETIYTKFKHKQDQSMDLEVNTVTIFDYHLRI